MAKQVYSDKKKEIEKETDIANYVRKIKKICDGEKLPQVTQGKN